ncbi:hypothetical protein ACFQHO_53210 [Actinomadura yumaensis]|uniref:hypothetical protein n=1 Tax=Actinomadura yumaensis TaxID=111807 RepID=UPI00361147A7
MKVVPRPTPDKWVRVTAGVGYVYAADPADGTYIVVNDADYDVRIPDAHATLRRLDLIVAQVHDAVDDAGTANDWDIVVVQGTPAQVPQMPGLPPASLPLAAVNVVPQAPSFPEKEIVDVREFLVASGGIMPVAGGSSRRRIQRSRCTGWTRRSCTSTTGTGGRPCSMTATGSRTGR